MITENREKLISLKDATKRVPALDGKVIHAGSVWRWCRRGMRGVRLEYVRCGRRIATSEEALHRFFEAVAQTDETSVDLATTGAGTDAASSELAERGL